MIVCIHVHFGKNLIVIYGVAKVKLCPTMGAYYLKLSRFVDFS